MWAWYRLPVVRVPTHKPVIRTKAADRVFALEEEKLEAAADRVAEAHKRGRPVLVGTWSVLTSERVGLMLQARGVDCQILNATREVEEAAIVAKAGLPGAVTVATNMAGRGTDIVLTPESRAAGGLLVIATERNDEARVDRQLAGRAGRQGDPGGFEQFVSLEDRLIQQHGIHPLVELVRRNAGPTRRWASGLLWGFAQRVASKRWAVMRAESTKADAWFEMAMQNVSR
jgi:preprotein translocase subunit SecA